MIHAPRHHFPTFLFSSWLLLTNHRKLQTQSLKGSLQCLRHLASSSSSTLCSSKWKLVTYLTTLNCLHITTCLGNNACPRTSGQKTCKAVSLKLLINHCLNRAACLVHSLISTKSELNSQLRAYTVYLTSPNVTRSLYSHTGSSEDMGMRQCWDGNEAMLGVWLHPYFQ